MASEIQRLLNLNQPVVTGPKTNDIFWLWREQNLVPVQIREFEVLSFEAGNILITSDLEVQGDVSIGGDLSVQGNISLGGTVLMSGNVSIAGDFYVAGAVSLGSTLDVAGDATFDSTVFLTSEVGTCYTSSTTETVDTRLYTDINIDTASNTLSLSDMNDCHKIQVRNRSSGNADLNFDIELQGVVYSAPVTMPAGDAYELTYDLTNTRWVI